jgi:hypothetical protein
LRFNANNVNSDIFFDTVNQKSLTIVGGVVLAVLIICAVWIGQFALVRSGTEVVGDVLSPDGDMAILRQLPKGTPVARHLSTDPASSDLTTPDESEQNAGNPERNGRAVTWYTEFGFSKSVAWHPTIANA